MNLIDLKYVEFLSLYMERFKKKGSNEWNFRCPICGDSAESQSKARGWIFTKNNSQELFFFCFNCQASMLFPTFLKTVNVPLYNEYIMEKFVNKNRRNDVTEEPEEIVEAEEVDSSVLTKLRKISQLPPDHPAVIYIQRRLIPTKWHKKLYFSEQFKKFVNGIIPDKFEDEEEPDPRIIIPFFSKDKVLIGFQGRSTDPSNKVRYITISLDENQTCMFGLESCKFHLPHLILEGPIDAMFCINSIATAGSISKRSSGLFNENSIFLFDNEPRAKQTCKKIQGVINSGYKIALFPRGVEEKDVNDYVMNHPDKAQWLIDHFYLSAASGAKAQLMFNDWRKV